MSIDIIIMGLFVGLLIGLTGVGGAALLTPVLIVAGINQSIAIGTDLVTILLLNFLVLYNFGDKKRLISN